MSVDDRLRYLRQRRMRRGGAGDPFAGVTQDATSGIYTPASSAEWSTFLSAAGLDGVIAVPNALWLFQDASGGAADAIGAFDLPETNPSGISYQQSVAGWTRKAITFTDGTAGSFKSTDAGLPDISAASHFTVLIGAASNPGAGTIRRIIGHGTTRSELRMMTAGPMFRTMSSANTADGAEAPGGTVRPLGLRDNFTAGTTTGFTNSEKMSPAHGAVTGKTLCVGANGDSNAPTMSVLYGWDWHGANAEVSDANYKTLLVAMGFSVSWT